MGFTDVVLNKEKITGNSPAYIQKLKSAEIAACSTLKFTDPHQRCLKIIQAATGSKAQHPVTFLTQVNI